MQALTVVFWRSALSKDVSCQHHLHGKILVLLSVRESRSMRCLLLLPLFGLPATSALACATCGCLLSTDAATGYAADAGWRVNLEYGFINQNQLRSGTRSIAPSEAAAQNNGGGNQEVERATIHRYTTLNLLYAANVNWNFKLMLPYIDRSHSTYGAAGNPLTLDQLSGVSVSGLGDVKLLASYQGWLPTRNLGLQLGVKLPSGHYGGPNADGSGSVGHQPAAFSSGPMAHNRAPENLLDTSLQLGTGSTDVIVGAYYYQAVSQDFDAFINGQFQAAVRQKLDQSGQDYRPGNLATVSFGLRYEAGPDIVPQLQVNLTRRSHDQGALADSPGTAGTAAFLSPGLSVNLKSFNNMQVYGFLQVPAYSKLDGYQVFPRWSATVGVSYAF